MQLKVAFGYKCYIYSILVTEKTKFELLQLFWVAHDKCLSTSLPAGGSVVQLLNGTKPQEGALFCRNPKIAARYGNGVELNMSD